MAITMCFGSITISSPMRCEVTATFLKMTFGPGAHNTATFWILSSSPESSFAVLGLFRQRSGYVLTLSRYKSASSAWLPITSSA